MDKDYIKKIQNQIENKFKIKTAIFENDIDGTVSIAIGKLELFLSEDFHNYAANIVQKAWEDGYTNFAITCFPSLVNDDQKFISWDVQAIEHSANLFNQIGNKKIIECHIHNNEYSPPEEQYKKIIINKPIDNLNDHFSMSEIYSNNLKILKPCYITNEQNVEVS